MNRRELLKFSLFAPLLGLFKKKEPKITYRDVLGKNSTCSEELKGVELIPRTTGTSSEGPMFWTQGDIERDFPLEFDRVVKGNEKERLRF